MLGPVTNFQINTPYSILSANWNFGDGTTGISSSNTITHRYSQFNEDGYKVTVELTRVDGVKTRQTFDVSIGSLADSIAMLYNESERDIANSELDISSFERQSLNHRCRFGFCIQPG